MEHDEHPMDDRCILYMTQDAGFCPNMVIVREVPNLRIAPLCLGPGLDRCGRIYLFHLRNL